MANGLSELSIPVGANIDWDYIERALRLDEFIKRREEQNREAARRFAGQQALQQSLAEGIPLDEAVRQNFSQLYAAEPSSIGQLLRFSQPEKPAPAPIEPEEITIGGQKFVRFGNRLIELQSESKAATAEQKLRIDQLGDEIRAKRKELESPFAEDKEKLQEQIATLEKRQLAVARGEPEPTKSASPTEKKNLANQLAKDNPTWTRAQIIAEVNKRLP